MIKKIVLILTGTIAGVVGSLLFTPQQTNDILISNTKPMPDPLKTSKNVASGTYVGNSVDIGYGFVQVKIKTNNSKMTDIVILKSPKGVNQRYTNKSIPNLVEQALLTQSANINSVSGASYTSAGFKTSLQSAISKSIGLSSVATSTAKIVSCPSCPKEGTRDHDDENGDDEEEENEENDD